MRVRRLTTLLQTQCDHRQLEELQLLQRGELDQASEVLSETFELLMTLLEFNPGDADLEVRLGYLYKDLAQVFETSDPARARRHVQTGLQLFEGLLSRRLTTDVEASAVNGLGNMYLMSGEYEQAIANCRRATQLMPEYANAWADLFLAYAGQAESGQADLDAMVAEIEKWQNTLWKYSSVGHIGKADGPKAWLEPVTPVVSAEELVACQRAVREVYVDEKVRRYLMQIVHDTRGHEDLSLGGSPRASIALFRSSQAMAALRGRNYVLPDDVKRIAGPVMTHRVILRPESRLRKVTAAQVVEQIIAEIAVPTLEGSEAS